MVKKCFIVVLFLLSLFVLPKTALAVRFDLIAPSGTLVRGQDIQFTVNIDTQGSTVTSQQIGLTYDTQYLSYVSVNPGLAMTTVSTSDQGGGKLLLTGTNSAGFSGTSSFAIVTLKLIAASAGSTQLCTLWSPVPTPTTPPSATNPPQATSPPGATAPPPPPKTGSASGTIGTVIIGLILIGGATGLYASNRPHHKHHLASSKKT